MHQPAHDRRFPLPLRPAGGWLLLLAVMIGALGCRQQSPTPAQANKNGKNGQPAAGEVTQPEVTLHIGDVAPELSVKTWVKGEPLEQFADDRIYVVEFWATWCKPCLTSMPHVSELQKLHADEVVIIGVTTESSDEVAKFLKKEKNGQDWNSRILYTLACDNEEESTDAYVTATGNSGVPIAFIIGRDGKIEWFGKPILLDEPLRQVVSGEWNRDLFLQRLADERGFDPRVRKELDQLARQEEWDSLFARLDDLAQQFTTRPEINFWRLTYLEQAGRTEEAIALVPQLIEKEWDDSVHLNSLAYKIATRQCVGKISDAKRAAERAVELTRETDANVLDTLAEVYASQSKFEQAVLWQEKAVQVDPTDPELSEKLESYQERVRFQNK